MAKNVEIFLYSFLQNFIAFKKLKIVISNENGCVLLIPPSLFPPSNNLKRIWREEKVFIGRQQLRKKSDQIGEFPNGFMDGTNSKIRNGFKYPKKIPKLETDSNKFIKFS